MNWTLPFADTVRSLGRGIADAFFEAGLKTAAVARGPGPLGDIAARIGAHLLQSDLCLADCEPMRSGLKAGVELLTMGLQ